jgi:hypothetical protein
MSMVRVRALTPGYMDGTGAGAGARAGSIDPPRKYVFHASTQTIRTCTDFAACRRRTTSR